MKRLKKLKQIQWSIRHFLVFMFVFFMSAWYLSIPNQNWSLSSLLQKNYKSLENHLSHALVESINSDSNWPAEIEDSGGEKYVINYTLNRSLETFLQNLLSEYRSSFTSIVVLDNNSGAILAALDYDGKKATFGKNLTFTPSSPAASIFKIITAADAIEKNETVSEDIYSYLGRPTTLYKHQLKETLQRFQRSLTLQKAFAQSNNVVFGKIALQHSDAINLYNTATKFGFNQEIFNLIKLSPSYFPVALDEYNLAELASGLNTLTMLSPIHAAKIAMTIANDGRSKSLKLIHSLSPIEDKTDDFLAYFPFQKSPDSEVISKHTAEELKKMMRETVNSGTGKIISKKLKREILNQLDIGGKTGQMTGGIPEGKRDWFITFARPKNRPNDNGISVAVMIINQNQWYVRSTQLAKEIIEYYFNNLFEFHQTSNYYSYQKR